MKNLILFESRDVVVVNKPCGMLSTPSRHQATDPRPCLGTLLQKELQQQIFPVHRLDFEVSGLILYAKNAKAHKILNRCFEKRLVKKTYYALSSVLPPKDWTLPHSFEIKNQILRGKKRAYESHHGKWSHTNGECLKVENGFSHWKLVPTTGLPHQLRLHLYQLGFPICGDRLYNAVDEFFPQAIALRAIQLDFHLAENLLKNQLEMPLIFETYDVANSDNVWKVN